MERQDRDSSVVLGHHIHSGLCTPLTIILAWTVGIVSCNNNPTVGIHYKGGDYNILHYFVENCFPEVFMPTQHMHTKLCLVHFTMQGTHTNLTHQYDTLYNESIAQ